MQFFEYLNFKKNKYEYEKEQARQQTYKAKDIFFVKNGDTGEITPFIFNNDKTKIKLLNVGVVVELNRIEGQSANRAVQLALQMRSSQFYTIDTLADYCMTMQNDITNLFSKSMKTKYMTNQLISISKINRLATSANKVYKEIEKYTEIHLPKTDRKKEIAENQRNF